MPLFNLTELAQILKPNQRVIGIDFGAKLIGLALSDVGCTLATPAGTLKRGKLTDTAASIRVLAKLEDAGALIVGLPLSMDGTLGPQAQAARDWSRSLAEATSLPTAMYDERLSSVAMNRFLVEQADLSRRKRADAIDRLAAAYMLQGALDIMALKELKE